MGKEKKTMLPHSHRHNYSNVEFHLRKRGYGGDGSVTGNYSPAANLTNGLKYDWQATMTETEDKQTGLTSFAFKLEIVGNMIKLLGNGGHVDTYVSIHFECKSSCLNDDLDCREEKLERFTFTASRNRTYRKEYKVKDTMWLRDGLDFRICFRIWILKRDQQRWKMFGKDLLSVFNPGNGQDAAICIDDGRKDIPIHMSVLAAYSPRFRAKFIGASPPTSITISGYPRSVVEGVLEYMYSRTCQLDIKPGYAEYWIRFAEEYQLEGHIMKLAKEVFSQSLTMENAIRRYRRGLADGVKTQQELVVKYIKKNEKDLRSYVKNDDALLEFAEEEAREALDLISQFIS